MDIKILFMGSSDFASFIFKALIDSKYKIVGVFTRSDKKVGREQIPQKTAVREIAEKESIPVFFPEKVDALALETVNDLNPDLIVVAAYGKILPKKVLDFPKYKAINVHASLLPKFRGPSPIQNAILDGEKQTGVTIMLMNEGIDTGDILAQKAIEIGPDEIYPELSRRMAEISASLLLETIPRWVGGKIEPVSQDDSQATLCQLVERSDGRVIWSDDAESIYNRYRAFIPWPGVHTFWEKDQYPSRIKLNKVSLLRNNPKSQRHIGEIFMAGEKIAVQATQGAVILEELQMEGKSNLAASEFIKGYPDFIGSVLK